MSVVGRQLNIQQQQQYCLQVSYDSITGLPVVDKTDEPLELFRAGMAEQGFEVHEVEQQCTQQGEMQVVLQCHERAASGR